MVLFVRALPVQRRVLAYGPQHLVVAAQLVELGRLLDCPSNGWLNAARIASSSQLSSLMSWTAYSIDESATRVLRSRELDPSPLGLVQPVQVAAHVGALAVEVPRHAAPVRRRAAERLREVVDRQPRQRRTATGFRPPVPREVPVRTEVGLAAARPLERVVVVAGRGSAVRRVNDTALRVRVVVAAVEDADAWSSTAGRRSPRTADLR